MGTESYIFSNVKSEIRGALYGGGGGGGRGAADVINSKTSFLDSLYAVYHTAKATITFGVAFHR